MNFIKNISAILFLSAFSATVTAQQIYNLDLESSISLAKEKSKTMLILRQSLQRAAFDLKAANSSFKTHVDLDLVVPQYTKTIRQWEDSSGISFFPIRQNLINGILTINQPLPTDGSLYIRSNVQNTADYYDKNRIAQINSSIGLRQPIEAFFGYNTLIMGYKQAKLNYELSLKQLKRTELQLIYDISYAFFTLLQYHELMNIAQLTLDKQKEAYEIARNKFKAGLIREVESLQMEVDMGDAINKLDIATLDYISQISLFKENLGIELNDSIIVKSELEYKSVTIDPEKAVRLALENRPELKADEIQIELTRMEIKRRKAAGRINGDIAVNYNFQGVNKSDLIIPMGTSINDTWLNLQQRPGNFGFGLTINVPIIDWGENRARVRSAQATLNQNQIQLDGDKIDIERDVRTAVSRLQSNLRRLQLLEQNVVIAEKSFEISRQRYSNGDIDSQSMALERERLNSAYLTRLTAFINYKLYLADIMRKTFFDFEKNVSLLNM